MTKKYPKPLVVTGALHAIQWIWGPQNHPPKSVLWMRQLKKCAGVLNILLQIFWRTYTSRRSMEIMFYVLCIPYNLYNLFLLLPQALTKDKPLTILIPQCISITCFGLRPDHMVFYRQLNEKSYHIRSSSEDNFCFLSQSSLLSFTKGGKRLKTWTPQALFSFLFSPPSLPSPPSSSKPLLAESRTPPSPSPWFPIVALHSEHSPQTPAYASTQRSKKSSGIYISSKYSAHNRYQNMEI